MCLPNFCFNTKEILKNLGHMRLHLILLQCSAYKSIKPMIFNILSILSSLFNIFHACSLHARKLLEAAKLTPFEKNVQACVDKMFKKDCSLLQLILQIWSMLTNFLLVNNKFTFGNKKKFCFHNILPYFRI